MSVWRRSEVLRQVGDILGVERSASASGPVEGVGRVMIVLKTDAPPGAHVHFLSLEMFWETDEEVVEENLRELQGFVASGLGMTEDQRPNADVLRRIGELIDYLLTDGDNRN